MNAVEFISVYGREVHIFPDWIRSIEEGVWGDNPFDTCPNRSRVDKAVWKSKPAFSIVEVDRNTYFIIGSPREVLAKLKEQSGLVSPLKSVRM